MFHKNFNRKGFALVTTLVLSTVILLACGVLLYKITSNSKEIVRRELLDKTLNIAESGVSMALEEITSLTFSDPENPGEMSSKDLINALYTTEWMIDDANNAKFEKLATYSKYELTGELQELIDNIHSDASHSEAFFDLFKLDNITAASGTVENVIEKLGLGLSLSPGEENKAISFDDLHEQAYITYRYKESGSEADIKLSIIPLTTNYEGKSDSSLHESGDVVNHAEVYKIRATAYSPNITNPLISRTIDLVIIRPIDLEDGKTYNFDHAILSNATVDLQNKTTTSGQTSTTIDEEQAGDVHSNFNLIIGSTGKVNGKATAAGTVTIPEGEVPATDYDPNSPDPDDPRTSTDSVSNKEGTKSGVDRIPMPEFDLDGLPTTPCPHPVEDGDILEDCYVTGDLTVSGGMDVGLKGTVYIRGNLSQSGNSSLTARGTEPVRVVVGTGTSGGVIDLAGSGNMVNEAEIIYISQATSGDAITIRGNPGTGTENGAVFVTTNPNTNVDLAGNIGFFGAVIAAGSVSGQGGSGGIKRDSDLSSLQDFVKPSYERDAFIPQIISWKEIKN